MRRNYLTDCLLLLLSLVLLVTGGVLWRRTCSCHRTAESGECPVSREIHKYASLAFITGIIVHLCWHWKWIQENTLEIEHEIHKA